MALLTFSTNPWGNVGSCTHKKNTALVTTMAASASRLTGSLQEYHRKTQLFPAYIVWVSLFFAAAAAVETNKKVVVFLAVCEIW